MLSSLTILQKALLIISIPVLAQAIFIAVLLRSRSEVAEAQRWAVHTKDVIAKTEEAYRLLLLRYVGARNLLIFDQAVSKDPAIDDSSRLNTALAELRVLVADNQAQQASIDGIFARVRAISDRLESTRRQFTSGERNRTKLGLEETALEIAEVRKQLDGVLAAESRLDQLRMSRMRRSSSWHFWTLVSGGSAILALTLLLALVYFARVVRRLEILTDNSRRLAEGKPLLEPLKGGDELAVLDRAFRETTSSLVEQKRENEMFVYSVSHDLRSPLINLQGFNGELKLAAGDLRRLFDHPEMPPTLRENGQKILSGTVTESVTYLHAAVERLAGIIDALLRLSRAGRVQFRWQRLDLDSIVNKVIDALRDSIKSKQAEIIVHSLPAAWGDPTAIEQVFANLLDNAVRYLDPERPGRIEVGSVAPDSDDDPSDVRVYYVKDNGLGIPHAYQDRVFTAFNRLHPDVAPGEGMGLALVRRVVERHGGRIWLESTAGAGTTFFVALRGGPPEGSQSAPGHDNSQYPYEQEMKGHEARAHVDRVGGR